MNVKKIAKEILAAESEEANVALSIADTDKLARKIMDLYTKEGYIFKEGMEKAKREIQEWLIGLVKNDKVVYVLEKDRSHKYAKEILALSKYDTNLEEYRYYEVVEPFAIYHHISSVPSNASYGNARIYKPVFKKVEAEKGDIICNLPGGLYHIKKGKTVAMPFDTEEREFSAFEHKRNYYNFDLTKLKQIKEPETQFRFFRPI